MTEASSWFPPIAPPPGGHARLAAALADGRENDFTPWQATFASVMLLAIAALPLAMRALRPDPVAVAIAAAAPVPGRDGALAVPTGAPGVQLYLVVATEVQP